MAFFQTHIVHPPQNGGQQNSNSADSNPSSFLQVHHEPRSTRSISRVLTSVPETVPEDEAVTSGDGVDGALLRVREQEGVDGENEVKLRRKSNVIHHRKSSVLMRLPRLRRPSKSFKRQSSLEEEITIRRYDISVCLYFTINNMGIILFLEISRQLTPHKILEGPHLNPHREYQYST